MTAMRDLTGQRFGKVIVEKRGPNHNGRVAWWCRCDCGGRKLIMGWLLVSGGSNSCGCFRRLRKMRKEMVGFVSGRLEVIEFAGHNRHKQAMWKCRCECGKEVVVLGAQLRSGRTKSCGCIPLGITRGESTSREGQSWRRMLDRCYNKRNTGYVNYGGRGIIVCQAWHDYQNFLASLGRCPDSRSLDRINVNGGYWCGQCEECKNNGWKMNCRWATRTEQVANRRNSLLVTYNDRTETLSWWAKTTGINWRCLYLRIFIRKWPEEEALTKPVGQKRGKTHCRNQTPEQRMKAKSRHAVSIAVRDGKMRKPPHCSHPGCTETKIEAHHHKGYEPEFALDIVWVCKKHHPKPNELFFLLNGERKSLTELSLMAGVAKPTMFSRLQRGQTPEEAVKIPLNPRWSYVSDGEETLTITAMARKRGVTPKVIKMRVERGLPLDTVLKKGKRKQPN